MRSCLLARPYGVSFSSLPALSFFVRRPVVSSSLFHNARRARSSCAVALIESYVGVLDIRHRIRPSYAAAGHTRAGRKIFLGRVVGKRDTEMRQVDGQAQ